MLRRGDWLLAAILIMVLAVGTAAAAGPEPVFDALPGEDAPHWFQGMSELSGAIAAEGTVASGLLAGEAGDFSATLTLRVLGPYSGTTGFLFGVHGTQDLWLAGFNPHEARFEILRQQDDVVNIMASADHEVSAGAVCALGLKVKGKQIVLACEGKEVLTVEADTPVRGQAGIGSVLIARTDVLIEKVEIRRVDGSAPSVLPSPEPLRWTPFQAERLSEGSGEWRSVQVFFPSEEWREETLRASLLLDPASPGERFRREIEVRHHSGYQGLGITGLVFGYRDATHYNLLGADPTAPRIVLWHRSPSGFEPLASADLAIEGDWLALAVEIEGDRAQVMAGDRILFDLRDPRFIGSRTGLATYGSAAWPGLWRRSVVRTSGEPLPPKEPDDLLALALGARAVYLEPMEVNNWQALVDHPIGAGENGFGEALSLDGAEGPLAVVFAFPHQRLARIEQLEVRLAGEEEVGSIRFLASMESPLAGFSELAVMRPTPGAPVSQVIDPVTAKYVRVELPEAAGKIGQVAEILLRGSLQSRAVARRMAQTAVTHPADLKEHEPNDTPQQAMRLPPTVWVEGSAGLGDVDHYLLHLPDQGGQVMLAGRNLGPVPIRYLLIDDQGREFAPMATEQSANGWSASYQLPGGPCWLRLTSEPVSLTVLFDDSGSMGTARSVLPKLLLGLADRVGPGLRIKLMKYAETPVEIFDFVDDPTLLRQAVEREVEASGGTDTMAGLMGGLASLRPVRGNRALLVALDGVDGYADPVPYHAFWQTLVATGAPVYIVGLGTEGWDSEDRLLRLSDRNFLSEVAWSSHGQFVLNPTVQGFEKNAGDILDTLSSATPYQIRAEFVEGELPQETQGQGNLRLDLAPGTTTGRVRTVELILDASNSMWGQIEGGSKIEIARKVLRSTIETLPEGVHLGLRVYGHRWPRADKRACADSELVFPVGPTDRDTLLHHIDGIRPKGRTPLVHSLLQAPADFHGLPRGTVVLVSDGIESCDGQIEDVVKKLHASNIDLTVHVVGFDVRERSSREELAQVAHALGGRYFDAGNAQELGASLEQALRIEYEVRVADGRTAARGIAGEEALALAAGDYVVRVLLEPEPVEMAVRVEPGKTQHLTLIGSPGAWKIEKR